MGCKAAALMAGGSDSFTEETSLALDEESSKVAESRASADVGTATGWAKEQGMPAHGTWLHVLEARFWPCS